jgi:predicted DNA-binding transcriptional regulator YafY
VRASERLRFDYLTFDGTAARREVEPHRLVHVRGRWYLVAWDVARDAWRTFRADRIRPRTPNGPRFSPRPEPEGGAAAYVQRGAGAAVWRYRARIKVRAPAAEIAARVPPALLVEALDERTCVVDAGSDSPRALAFWLGQLDADFEVVEGPELATHLRTLGERYLRAAAAP